MKSAKPMACVMLALCIVSLQSVAASSANANEERFVFETRDKQQVDAFRGTFTVPENRAATGSRMIPIKYVRLAATGGKAGPPIVYLAGGPGGSGIQAINYRYRMFMAMRKHADVIALDQRGTGDSNVVSECRSGKTIPSTTATTDRLFAEYYRDALSECLAFWRQEGVDLAGYNTVQNAQDLDALRRHLGATRIVLWGTSYGSHLALAALKEMRGSVDRVVVSSVEGLNQTFKLPARAEQYLDRLQAAIDTQPAAKAAYPDVKVLMRRVHAKLEREPVRVHLKSRDGSKTDYLLQRRDMQLLAAGLIADPRSAAQLLGIYDAIDRGVEPPLDQIPARLLPDHLAGVGVSITLEAMPIAMDMASGMTADHRRRILDQAKTAILGNYLDFAVLFDGMAPELDLGDAFRAEPVSNVPVLVFSGTLDGRTPVESQHEAVSRLENATMITVENAGHNLSMSPRRQFRKQLIFSWREILFATVRSKSSCQIWRRNGYRNGTPVTGHRGASLTSHVSGPGLQERRVGLQILLARAPSSSPPHRSRCRGRAVKILEARSSRSWGRLFRGIRASTASCLTAPQLTGLARGITL